MCLLTSKQNTGFDFDDNFNDICVDTTFTLLETCPGSAPISIQEHRACKRKRINKMEICKLHQCQIELVGGNMNPVLRITEEVRKAAQFL